MSQNGTTSLHCFGCGAKGEKRWALCKSCHGWFHFVDEDTHLRLIGEAPPIRTMDGLAQVIPDRMAKHYDYAVGAWIDSRSQKNRVYAENDMIMVSAAEEAKKKGAPTIKCKARSYPGQKDRRSSSEKWTGARTKTGQEMI